MIDVKVFKLLHLNFYDDSGMMVGRLLMVITSTIFTCLFFLKDGEGFLFFSIVLALNLNFSPKYFLQMLQDYFFPTVKSKL